MTQEERKEHRKAYLKEWRKNNKDKIKESRINRMRRKALEDIESIKKADVTTECTLIYTKSGGVFMIQE